MDGLISALLSPDNGARRAAEAAYTQALQQQTEAAAAALVASLQSPSLGAGERSLACVLVARLARHAPLRQALSPPTAAALQAALWACVSGASSSAALRHAASHACVQWAAALGPPHPNALLAQSAALCSDPAACAAGAGLLRSLADFEADDDEGGEVAVDAAAGLTAVHQLLVVHADAAPAAATLSAAHAGLAWARAAVLRAPSAPAAALGGRGRRGGAVAAAGRRARVPAGPCRWRRRRVRSCACAGLGAR